MARIDAARAGIPTKEGEPVFHAPWEARAFAMAVTLAERGHYTWAEFQDRLIAEIASAGAGGDRGQRSVPGYYEHWLRALEKLLGEKGLVMSDLVDARASELASTSAPYDDHESDDGMSGSHSH
jgi:nitrile hydratase accessory protein